MAGLSQIEISTLNGHFDDVLQLSRVAKAMLERQGVVFADAPEVGVAGPVNAAAVILADGLQYLVVEHRAQLDQFIVAQSVQSRLPSWHRISSVLPGYPEPRSIGSGPLGDPGCLNSLAKRTLGRQAKLVWAGKAAV